MHRDRIDLVCFSHLRWDHVFQRPNHLMVRAARTYRVWFIEEPLPGSTERTEVEEVEGGVRRVRFSVTETDRPAASTALRGRLDGLLASQGIERPALWYYAPLALEWSAHVPARAVVYDCMDELAAFAHASPRLADLESRLFRAADVCFTGGRSLYEAKRSRHPRVHLFPSSVDVEHFARARGDLPQPPDQAAVRRPRLGYVGVIDERLDLDLLAYVARTRPDWQIVMVGPLAKIEDRSLPRAPNIHYLGRKSYFELPAYLSGWDVALMPFALNEATRFISPTKTPEYLAAGRRVVSTAVADVVDPYGRSGLVTIADGAASFVRAAEAALEPPVADWLERVDAALAGRSWDRTWGEMDALLRAAMELRASVAPSPSALSGIDRLNAARATSPSTPTSTG